MRQERKNTILESEAFANTTNERLQQSRSTRKRRSGFKNNNINGDASNADSGRQPSEEHRETKSRQFAEKSFSANWSDFPTQPPVCRGDDGISGMLDSKSVLKKGKRGKTYVTWRNESIKSLGNAIVPQVALQLFKTIEQFENIK